MDYAGLGPHSHHEDIIHLLVAFAPALEGFIQHPPLLFGRELADPHEQLAESPIEELFAFRTAELISVSIGEEIDHIPLL